MVLQGPAGSGKSALLEEFAARRCQASKVLLVQVNAADCLLAQDVFASLLAGLRARSQQIVQKAYRDTRRLRSLKGLNWGDAEFGRMIAGTDRAQSGQSAGAVGEPVGACTAAPLGGRCGNRAGRTESRGRRGITGSATALGGFDRGDAGVASKRARRCWLWLSIRWRGCKPSLSAPLGRPSRMPWPRLACRRWWSGPGLPRPWNSFGKRCQRGLRRQPAPSNLLAGEERERLRQRLARCLPSTRPDALAGGAWRGARHPGAGLAFSCRGGFAVAEDAAAHTMRELVRDDTGALVGRIVTTHSPRPFRRCAAVA